MLNLNINDPSLADLLNAFKKDIFISLNCHAVAKIDTFDSENQTCKAQIVYKKTIYKRKEQLKNNPKEGVSVVYEPKEENYPILVDCPVMILSGGSSGLTMPIKKGDECLILFNDRDIDNWFDSGNATGKLASPRKHSLSDGIAIVGIRSLAKSIQNYNTERPTLYNGETKISLSDSKIKLENSTESLNDILQDLITAVRNLITTNCVVGSPVTLNPATQTQLDTIANRLGELIE